MHDDRPAPLEARARLGALLERHYADLRQAPGAGRPVAWCSAAGPVELLHALGFAVHFPENHGVLLGATRAAGPLLPRAAAAGFSPDACSYLAADVGAHLAGRSAPLEAAHQLPLPPPPDVLVCHTQQCRDVQDWFAWHARRTGAPLVAIHGWRGVGAVTAAHVTGVAEQLRAALPTLETAARCRLDPARLRDAVEASAECSRQWRRALDAAAARPAPFTFFDAAPLTGPAVMLRGRPEAAGFCAALADELYARARAKRPAVPDERIRLYWDGMPVWGRLRELERLFRSRGAAVVASTYAASWVFPTLDPEQPWESLARAAVEIFVARDDDAKEAFLDDETRMFAVHGLIFHQARTCPANSNAAYGMPERLARRLERPVLVLHGDHTDPAGWADEPNRTRIEAFLEQCG